MANPITIPSNAFLIPVNLSSSYKTFTLPVVSTNAGRLLIFKDMFGNAANSTLRLSTIGLDRIERSNVSSMTLSNQYGAWWFQNDGLTNWFLTTAYLNSIPIIQALPPYLAGLWVKFYTNTGSQPSSNGPPASNGGNNWGTPITGTMTGTLFNGSNTPGASSVIYYGNNFSALPQGNANYSGVYTGFFYSAVGGTVIFQMATDDGMRVDFNGSNVLLSWIPQGEATYTSASLPLSAGYTPILMRWYDTGGGGASRFLWNINSSGYTSNGAGVFFYATSNITQL